MTNAVTDRFVVHNTFVIEHEYDVKPAKVFAAFASQDAKRRWFGGPEDGDPELTLDFRVGGEEVSVGAPHDGAPVFKYIARYQDIVPDTRIVSTYNMWVDGALISVSVATVDLEPTRDGTKLTYTEQAAYLDGKDQPRFREHGVRELLVEKLARHLGQPSGTSARTGQ